MVDRERIVKDHIQMIGEESFPDDQVKWNIIKITFKENYAFVESEPSPATVGYAKFTFVVRFPDNQSCTVAGCYCWDHNKWDLLFTDPKEPENWKILFNGI